MSLPDSTFDPKTGAVNSDPELATTIPKNKPGMLTRTETGLEFIYPYTASVLTAAIQFVLTPIWAGLRDGNNIDGWLKILFSLESSKMITASIHGLFRLGAKGETPLADGLGAVASFSALVGILRIFGHNVLGSKDAPDAFQLTFALITLPTVLKAVASLRNTVAAPFRIQKEKRNLINEHNNKAVLEAASNIMATASAAYTGAWAAICLVGVISGLQHSVEKALTAAEYAGLVAGILTTVGIPASLVVKAAAEVISRLPFFKLVPEDTTGEHDSLLPEPEPSSTGGNGPGMS